ncbi:MAG: methionyl-tRNA formyltransferase [Patescibacteria group bacterium]|nr:methionyl-tRNA formyltransferase [Patescibacteria group bacterium]
MANSKINYKIIFMGTSEFGAIILEGLINSEYKPILVATAPDKPIGRKQILTPPPVKILAEKYKISVVQPERILNLKSLILNLKPDLIVVAAYGQILPKEILEIPKFGCLNLHPSLLPRWRGPSPIQYTILNGDETTGVTIILMDEKMDHGPILAQQELKFSISNLEFSNLHDKLAELETELLLKTIPKWIKGEIKPKPQDESKTTYTKILTREDGKIDWKKSAEDLERQIRAFNPWPGTFTFWEIIRGKLLRIKIFKAKVFQSPTGKTFPIGKVLIVPQNKVGVQCTKDFLLIEKLQLEGRKPMESEEFLRGHPNFIGAILK